MSTAYANWLETELPGELAKTEHWKDAKIRLDGGLWGVGVTGCSIYPGPNGPTFMSCKKYVEFSFIPIISEACALITLIESKRRELE